MSAKKPDRIIISELRAQVESLKGELECRVSYMRNANLRLVARCERTEAILASTLSASLSNSQ